MERRILINLLSFDLGDFHLPFLQLFFPEHQKQNDLNEYLSEVPLLENGKEVLPED